MMDKNEVSGDFFLLFIRNDQVRLSDQFKEAVACRIFLLEECISLNVKLILLARASLERLSIQKKLKVLTYMRS